MLSVPPGKELDSYVSAVEYCSQRKLTKQEDKMNAFQGISQRYKGISDGKTNSFYYGLPRCAFDQTFCWYTRQHNPHLRNESFPSWSWLGWNDAVLFDRKTIQTARTSQMIYAGEEYTYHNKSAEARGLRKPAWPLVQDGSQHGFPASLGGLFYNSPDLPLYGSVAHLRIATDPVESDGSNALYAVFSTRCGDLPPLPPPRTITLRDLLTQPLPEIHVMDAETQATPSVPSVQQIANDCDLSEHDRHETCEAKNPLGYIWLDREWREQKHDNCVMEFMALAGEKDVNREGQWIITMLMCLQRMEKNGHYWAEERVQVMQCDVEEERWLKTGAQIAAFILT